MKILIVNFSDIEGGAARAANRLHKSLLKKYIISRMFVEIKISNDYTILGPETNFEKFWAKSKAMINIFRIKHYKNISPFSPSFAPTFKISKQINKINPDIVHLHWINAGMLKIEDLSKIKAPIVWSLHDMWPFTGGCHYSNNCKSYEVSCGNCVVLQSNKTHDLSRKMFLRKEKTFNQIPNLTIIGLSKWMEKCAKRSKLFKNRNIINLPNPIDTNVFKLVDRSIAKELWGLPKDKKLILFGAMNSTTDIRKGFQQLRGALEKVENKNIELLVYGSSKPKEVNDFEFKINYLGQLYDDISLTTLYNAVDLMIVPSLQENLSNVIMESLACSTPVVAFKIGGNSDLIEHKINGYLAKPFDTNDLALGIDWVFNNDDYESICKNAREKVLKEFDSEIVAKKYIDLYRSILKSEKLQF